MTRTYYRVENAGTNDGKSASRMQQEIDQGLRCAKCTIYVFCNEVDARLHGVGEFSYKINLAVPVDGQILCVGCAKGV